MATFVSAPVLGVPAVLRTLLAVGALAFGPLPPVTFDSEGTLDGDVGPDHQPESQPELASEPGPDEPDLLGDPDPDPEPEPELKPEPDDAGEQLEAQPVVLEAALRGLALLLTLLPVPALHAVAAAWLVPRLDGKVILTPPCIFH